MNEENVVCLGTREYGRSYVQSLNEIKSLQQQLKDKDEKISKVIKYATHTEFEERTAYDTSFCEGVYNVKENVLKILETNKEE